MAITLSGCTKDNAVGSNNDYVQVIADSCGHASKKGAEVSYDLVLKVMYSNKNVAWEKYDASRLKYSECLLLSDKSISLGADYKYALCKITPDDGEEIQLVFAYDTSSKEVVACFDDRQDNCTNNAGGFIGEDRRIWGVEFAIENCYYIKDLNYNTTLFGTSFASSDVVGEVEGKSSANLRNVITFVDWNFDAVWSISADINGGYPYLQGQEGALSDIAVSGVEINEATLALTVGDYAYLTATVSPVNASNKSLTWSSSDSAVATVSAAGKITAFSAGTAIITVTTEDGGYTATCTVTVTERISEEYKINSITVRNNEGAVLSAIPSDGCLATVSITNLASEGNTLVFLAAYTAEGQYQGMMWVSVEDLPVGATIKVTLPINNSAGKIENLKAFTVASFSNLTPLGEAVSFLQ